MRVFVVATLLALCLCNPPLFAKEEAELAPGRSEVKAVDQDATGPMTRLQVVFSGGVLMGEGLKAIQSAVPGKIQFVVGTDAEQLPIPNMTIREGRLLDVLNLLANVIPELSLRISFGSGYVPLHEAVEYVCGAGDDLQEVVKTGRWEESTAIVLVGLAETDRDEDPYERQMRIFRLEDVLDAGDATVEQVATAIETVWGMGPQRRVASLRYHTETKLLVCYGSPEHIGLAERVVARISGDDAPSSYVSRTARLEADVQRMHEAVKALKLSHRQLSQQLQRARKEKDALEQKFSVLDTRVKAFLK